MRDGQVIILSGFLVTVALVAITLILNDIIFVSNSSSIESIELSRSTYQDLHRLIREEAQWARNITRNNASNFTQHMKTFLYVLTKSYATQGVSVSATPSFNDTGVINNSDRVAYCCGSRGTCSDASYGVLPWMDSLGKIDNDSAQSALDYNYTDFGTCYDLLTNTSAWCQNASGERECHRSDFNVTIFESPDLDNTSLTPAMWSRLLNWTNKTWRGKERKFIQIGNGTVLDVLFHDTPDAYTMIGGTALNGWGNITAYVPTLTDSVGVVCTPEPAPGDAPTLLKWGVKSGDTVQFNTTGYIIYDNPLYTVDSLYVHIRPMTGAFSACTGVTGGGLAVNWTRSTSSSEWGHIYYLPTLRGSLNDSRGFYTFRENLRPIFNLFGTCRIEVSYSDGISTSNSTIYC